MIKITLEELRVYSRMIHAMTGVYLDDTKAYLFEHRLVELLATCRCSTFSELYYQAEADVSGSVRWRIIDALLTGETSFFRDPASFELLRHKVLPDLVDRRTHSRGTTVRPAIRIWSAACSTGQELYSIAIVLKELLGSLSSYDMTLLGTDLSAAAIAKATAGSYNTVEVTRGLEPHHRERYFVADGDRWTICDELRSHVSFRPHNLMQDFRHLGRFDIVFCRNVAIYFKESDRQQLFDRLSSVLEPDGYLFVGATESIVGLCPQYESKRYLRSVYYQLSQATLET